MGVLVNIQRTNALLGVYANYTQARHRRSGRAD